MKKKLIVTLLTLTLVNLAIADVSLKVKPNSANIIKGSIIGAFADYEIVIINPTSDKQIYSYSAILCPDLNKCEQQVKNNITILPNDKFIESFRLGTMIKYNNPGSFANKAILNVTGYENNQKTEIGYINVY